MTSRLKMALEAGAVTLPEGRIAVFRPGACEAWLPEGAEVITGFYPDFAAWEARGLPVARAPEGDYAGAVVCVPRAKALARDLLAQAAALGGPVLVDGAKTDGVESLWKAARKQGEASAAFSKAHGKVFAVTDGDFSSWRLPDVSAAEGGWVTAPGVFSADGPDAGSELLAGALPAQMKGRVADLGAGWGFLAAAVLKREGVTAVELVEAEWAALEAARVNVTDARARFTWGDATQPLAEPVDHVVMNPPFHPARAADPALGTAFIASAAASLKPSGKLWMVANRHLPYEAALAGHFGEVSEIGGDTRFKLFSAARPARQARR
ncbi:class I SAM-dependent methyltransferase [Vannielia litorea]|uniref:class I SAM-dependent methyltransferase n=1 Tax=Vannielia litorea TaxID=1217970 RepID=UPI001BCC5C03|nr:methyltransferase [Vannielia litorea]MBS8226099.1 class I SAM-dependent methyltransferase [Vannielia litorea]